MVDDGSSELAYDALIVGAGPAGAALALALSRRGRRVLLLDRGARARRTMGEALSGVSRWALTELGLWSSFLDRGYPASTLVRSVWGSPRVVERDAFIHRPAPDWHVDRAMFDEWLVSEAERAGSEVLRPARVQELTLSADGGVALLVEHGGARRTLRARSLADATGRAAFVSRRVGGTRWHADRLVGVARWLDAPDLSPYILLESSAEGWFYSGPGPADQLVSLFVTDVSSPLARAAQPEIWAEAVRSAPLTRERLGERRFDDPPCALAAGPALTSWDTELPFLPVGDAAVSFDPISGDGLCFAFRSALEGAWAIDETLCGRPGAITAYRAGLSDVFAEHLGRRASIYQAERRFRDAPFWKQRGLPVTRDP